MPKIPNYSDDAPVPLHVPLAEGSNFRLAPVRPDSTVDFGAQASGKAFDAIGGLANQLAIKAQAQANQKDVTDRLTGYNRDMGNLYDELMARNGEMVMAADATADSPARDSIVAEYSKRSAEIYNNYFGGNPVVQQEFRKSALATENTYAVAVTKHYNEQYGVAQTESNNALLKEDGDRLETALRMKDYQTADRLLAESERYQWNIGMVAGTTDEQMKLNNQAFLNDHVVSVVNNMSINDPNSALEILNRYGDRLPQSTKDALMNKLSPQIESSSMEKIARDLVAKMPELTDEYGNLKTDLLIKAMDDLDSLGKFDVKVGGGGSPLKRWAIAAANRANQIFGAHIKPEWMYGLGIQENGSTDSAMAYNTDTGQMEETYNFANVKYNGHGKYMNSRTKEAGTGDEWVGTQWETYNNEEEGGAGWADWMQQQGYSASQFQNVNSAEDLGNLLASTGYFTDENKSGYVANVESASKRFAEDTGGETVHDPHSHDKIVEVANSLAAEMKLGATRRKNEFAEELDQQFLSGSFHSEQEVRDWCASVNASPSQTLGAVKMFKQDLAEKLHTQKEIAEADILESQQNLNKLYLDNQLDGTPLPSYQMIKSMVYNGELNMTRDDLLKYKKLTEAKAKWLTDDLSNYINEKGKAYKGHWAPKDDAERTAWRINTIMRLQEKIDLGQLNPGDTLGIKSAIDDEYTDSPDFKKPDTFFQYDRPAAAVPAGITDDGT